MDLHRTANKQAGTRRGKLVYNYRGVGSWGHTANTDFKMLLVSLSSCVKLYFCTVKCSFVSVVYVTVHNLWLPTFTQTTAETLATLLRCGSVLVTFWFLCRFYQNYFWTTSGSWRKGIWIGFSIFSLWVYFYLGCGWVYTNRKNWKINMCQRQFKSKGLSDICTNAQFFKLYSQYYKPKLYGNSKKPPSSEQFCLLSCLHPLTQSKPFSPSKPNFLEKNHTNESNWATVWDLEYRLYCCLIKCLISFLSWLPVYLLWYSIFCGTVQALL